ncbi:unnamed protein product [Somion occarium]|uniref:P-loop containing nucleoside triphosphate hydrolase protein n=1 Tax=Somion occarium TaxID=3059160 RepID=A0ABP1CJE4_9APHY
MNLEPNRPSRLTPASSSSSLKRSYAHEAIGHDVRSNSPSPVPSASSQSSSSFAGSSGYPDNGNQRPTKVPKLEGPRFVSSAAANLPHHMSHPFHQPSSSSPLRGGKTSTPSAKRGISKYSSRGSKPNKNQRRPSFSVISGPLYDALYIEQLYPDRHLKGEWKNNPKSPISNYCNNVLGIQPRYEVTQHVTSGGKQIFRCTLIIPDTDASEGDVIAYGDSTSRKEAEILAAMHALHILESRGLVGKDAKAKKKAPTVDAPTEATLSDGTVIDFERARQFMDYYCRRFHFGKPDIAYEYKSGPRARWEAVMTVGGRKIGLGAGAQKKAAMMSCYVDVTQYLESCDPDLWKQFVQDAKTGKDLGMAPSFLFQISGPIEDRIQDVCTSVKTSTIYRRRPKIGSLLTEFGVADTHQQQQPPTAPRYVAPARRQADATVLGQKSTALQERRKAYLADASLQKMRDTRAALPVYTKSIDILEQIEANDVTICMATTGSGKTTQIPQLILDQWIERGEGAKCNIICTQPRRIAAISVASRVATERGEVVGKGSVGYQVRFEAKLPEDHGSITFCTTGIFLKRMHSALQDEGHRAQNLDDVTHLIVDEVHERDVDTDLLLVVLKRLLADRKARNKPLKIVLMSATIDPTLFRQYFTDNQGKPASVIEVPGRSFPVQKHFLDDYVPQLVSSDTRSNWVFRDDSVQKYIVKELGLQALPPALQASSRYKSSEDIKDEDLDQPYPLIALAVSHVLRKTDDGHVLVFLAGWDDITGVQKCLLDGGNLGVNFNDQSKFSIHLLHSSIPVAEQQVIFDPPPPGVRRIILSTNIAETSVTIPDVVYVVDTARIKENRFDPERHISSLVSAWVGSSNLNQRAGRAGRHRPGEYYGILSSKRAEELHPYQTVEMKRVDLTNVVMHVKALDFPGMTVEEVLAELIEPPAPERVEAAMHSLMMVGALDQARNLTSLGRVLLQLPVEVQMGKMVLFGSFFRCLDSALTLAAILTNRDPFLSPMHLKQRAAEVKNSFTPDEFRSDALAILNAYNKWWALQGNGEWNAANRFCMDNFLSKPTLLMIQKIKGHLLQSLYDIGVIDVSAGGTAAKFMPRRKQEAIVPRELNINGNSLPLLAALITIASQPKFAIRSGEKTYRTSQDKAVFIHPSSVNNRRRELAGTRTEAGVETSAEKQIIAYAEKRQNISVAGAAAHAQKFLVTTSRVDPLTYMLFGAHHIEVTQRGLICDEWLPVVGRGDALDDVERLKALMESCMLRVFEGITQGRAKRRITAGPVMPREEKEEESEDEDDDNRLKDYALSETEIQELDLMTQEIAQILNDYNAYRVANQSRHNSRPGTPIDSPGFSLARLGGGGTRSGYSTPGGYGNGPMFSSRPGTPSRLSKRWG